MSDNPLDGCFDAAPRATALTMSSREIADLCEKRHDHVMVDIRKMLEELGLHAPDFSGAYKTDRGNKYECFHLPKRETLILVSGYKLVLRAAIIDRWQELEQQVATRKLPATSCEVTVAGLEPQALGQVGGVMRNVAHRQSREMIGAIERAINEHVYQSATRSFPVVERYIDSIIKDAWDKLGGGVVPTVLAKIDHLASQIENLQRDFAGRSDGKVSPEPVALPRMSLRTFRKMRGWSMAKMGAKVSATASAVAKHEHGVCIPAPHVVDRYYQVSGGRLTADTFYDAYRARWGGVRPRANSATVTPNFSEGEE